jgi:HNH endonuclease
VPVVSHPLAIITYMKTTGLDEVIEVLEKINADLEPDLLSVPQAKTRLREYTRARRLIDYGITMLARRVDDVPDVARITGTSVGRARDTVATGTAASGSGELGAAMQEGALSLEQATEIAKAEASAPGAAGGLIDVARSESFHVLKERALKTKLEAEQHRGLATRQRSARSARSYSDALGMVNINLSFEPHVGTPLVARAEAEAARLAKEAHKEDRPEPFERHLADAFAVLMSGGGKGRAKRPELVVLVSHEIAKRGWKDVKKGEVCKIPGVGPVAPEVAKAIAKDAFLTGLFYDGKDLRHTRRWTRNTPVEVRLALELGDPPDFDGIRCVDCGNRFKTENDHVEPHVALGPASIDNLRPRCWSCHQAKTKRDRLAGKLRARGP